MVWGLKIKEGLCKQFGFIFEPEYFSNLIEKRKKSKLGNNFRFFSFNFSRYQYYMEKIFKEYREKKKVLFLVALTDWIELEKKSCQINKDKKMS